MLRMTTKSLKSKVIVLLSNVNALLFLFYELETYEMNLDLYAIQNLRRLLQYEHSKMDALFNIRRGSIALSILSTAYSIFIAIIPENLFPFEL